MVATKLIIPTFSTEGYWFLIEYKPEYLLIDTNKKLLFLVQLFAPLLFAPLLNKYILIASPVFARILFSNRETRYTITNQHTSLIVPFMFLSSIYLIKNLSENEQIRKLFSMKLVYAFLVFYLATSFFINPIKTDILSHNQIRELVVIPEGGPSPQSNFLAITPHYKSLYQIINMIPNNASVYTQNNIFPHMANRPKVFYVPGDNQIFRGWNNPQIAKIVPWKEGNFEYILVDNSIYNKKWGTLKNLDPESIELLRQNYGVYIAIDQIYLFKRDYTGPINVVPSLYDNFDNKFINDYYNGVLISYYNDNNLTGYPTIIERAPNINFKWKKLSPVPGAVNRGNFSLKFDGYIYAPQDGYYSFQLLSDGGL